MHSYRAPEPLHPLAIESLALSPQKAVGHLQTPADLLSGDLREEMAEPGLLDIDNSALMVLGAAVLHRHPADKAFRSPVTIV